MTKYLISIFNIDSKENLCITMPMDLISLPEQASLFDIERFISRLLKSSIPC